MSPQVSTVLLVGDARSIHTRRWAVGLAECGLRVHLATVHAPHLPYPSTVVVHPLAGSRSLGYLRSIRPLRRLVRDLRPDLINAHYAAGYGVATYVALGGTAYPWMLSVWGSDVYDFPIRSAAYRALVSRAMRAATLVGATSESLATVAREAVPGIDVIVTPFGVDLTSFPLREDDTRPATDTPLVIGSVRALAPKYGVDLLIDAFALLRGLRPGLNVKLRIVGEGPDRADLELRAASLGCADDVEFIGKAGPDAVASWHRTFDVFVALSRSESYGVAILEAAASGLPVVVSDADGPREITVDGVTGFVIPHGDPARAAERIADLLDDPALRARMGRAGRQHVADHYAAPIALQKMIGAYGEAVSRAISPRRRPPRR